MWARSSASFTFVSGTVGPLAPTLLPGGGRCESTSRSQSTSWASAVASLLSLSSSSGGCRPVNVGAIPEGMSSVTPSCSPSPWAGGAISAIAARSGDGGTPFPSPSIWNISDESASSSLKSSSDRLNEPTLLLSAVLSSALDPVASGGRGNTFLAPMAMAEEAATSVSASASASTWTSAPAAGFSYSGSSNAWAEFCRATSASDVSSLSLWGCSGAEKKVGGRANVQRDGTRGKMRAREFERSHVPLHGCNSLLLVAHPLGETRCGAQFTAAQQLEDIPLWIDDEVRRVRAVPVQGNSEVLELLIEAHAAISSSGNPLRLPQDLGRVLFLFHGESIRCPACRSLCTARTGSASGRAVVRSAGPQDHPVPLEGKLCWGVGGPVSGGTDPSGDSRVFLLTAEARLSRSCCILLDRRAPSGGQRPPCAHTRNAGGIEDCPLAALYGYVAAVALLNSARLYRVRGSSALGLTGLFERRSKWRANPCGSRGSARLAQGSCARQRKLVARLREPRRWGTTRGGAGCGGGGGALAQASEDDDAWRSRNRPAPARDGLRFARCPSGRSRRPPSVHRPGVRGGRPLTPSPYPETWPLARAHAMRCDAMRRTDLHVRSMYSTS
eukprot:scaffold56_cov379-Prasinococcus_capsulatus_cf.AAC.8